MGSAIRCHVVRSPQSGASPGAPEAQSRPRPREGLARRQRYAGQPDDAEGPVPRRTGVLGASPSLAWLRLWDSHGDVDCRREP